MKFLGHISWAAYSFHWPLMCSFGAVLLLRVQGIRQAFLSAFLICVIMTILISFLYSISIAKAEKSIAVWIDKGLTRAKRIFVKAQ